MPRWNTGNRIARMPRRGSVDARSRPYTRSGRRSPRDNGMPWYIASSPQGAIRCRARRMRDTMHVAVASFVVVDDRDPRRRREDHRDGRAPAPRSAPLRPRSRPPRPCAASKPAQRPATRILRTRDTRMRVDGHQVPCAHPRGSSSSCTCRCRSTAHVGRDHRRLPLVQESRIRQPPLHDRSLRAPRHGSGRLDRPKATATHMVAMCAPA